MPKEGSDSPVMPPGTAGRVGSAWFANKERALLGLTGLVSVLVLWELLGRSGWVNPLFSSSPSRVLRAGISYVSTGEALADAGATLAAFGAGFLMAIVAGIMLGLLMGWYRRLEALLDPVFSFAYTSPRPALLPLIIIWFGIGLESKIALVFISALFPIVFSTATGVRTIDHAVFNVARSFSASTWQIFRTIVLPSSVPHVISGLRIALGHALTAVIFAEMVAANKGIGYAMGVAANTFNTDLVFFGFFLVGGTGVLVTEILRRIERHFERWRPDIQR